MTESSSVASAVPGAYARVLSPRTPESVRMLREAGVRDMSLGQTLGIPEAEAGLAGVLPGGGDVALPCDPDRDLESPRRRSSGVPGLRQFRPIRYRAPPNFVAVSQAGERPIFGR